MKVLIFLALASSAYGVFLPVPAVPQVAGVAAVQPIVQPWNYPQHAVYYPNDGSHVWQPTDETAAGVIPAFQPKIVAKSTTWGAHQPAVTPYPGYPYGYPYGYGHGYPYYRNGLNYPAFGNGLVGNGLVGNGLIGNRFVGNGLQGVQVIAA